MSAKNEDILIDVFEQWRIHPVTVEFIKCLEKHKQAFVNTIANEAWDFNQSDTQVRITCSALKTLDAVKSIVTNYLVFKELVRRR